jgi:hypothetical protein
MGKWKPQRIKTALPREASNLVEFNINKARNNYIDHVVEPWDKSMDWIMEQCFPKHVLNACKLGYQFTTDTVRRHNSLSLRILSNVSLQVGGKYLDDVAKILPPKEEYLIGPAETCLPKLVEHCHRIRQILYDYAKVLHVFEWFNTCGSSAISLRSYCPWIQTVLPGQYHSHIEGARFREPDGLAPMLDLIREVAGIMGRALLIQGEVGDRPKQSVNLYFVATTVNGIAVPAYTMEL